MEIGAFLERIDYHSEIYQMQERERERGGKQAIFVSLNIFTIPFLSIVEKIGSILCVEAQIVELWCDEFQITHKEINQSCFKQ